MEGRFFGEGQSRAFEALRSWHEAGRPSACVVHGPSGAGKSTVVERFFRSITGPGTLKLLVHAGRTFGAAFEEEVLARLSAGPWPEGTAFDEFHFGVRTSLVNRIVNWGGEDGQPQLLIGLLAPETARIMALAALCLAAPEPSRPALAARAVAAYHDDRGTEALESVVRCAPWMSLATAARLFVVSLGDAAEDVSLVSTLSRWGGVEQLAPLIARIGGGDALAAAASVLSEALRWKSRAKAESKECSTSGVAPAGLDDGRSTME
ncbi:ATP-binding protein [Sorangium sp. So ce429]